MITNKSIITYCWYLVLFSIGFDYISKSLYTLEIGTFIGLLMLTLSSKFSLRHKDIVLIGIYLFFVSGIYFSRIFYVDYNPRVVNLMFVLKNLGFFLFTYLYLSKVGYNKTSLILISLFTIPHLLMSFTGSGFLTNSAQFGGFQNDPNYLAPDLLAALVAQYYLFINERINKYRVFYFVLILTTYFLILISGSRTATMASLIIFLFYLFISNRNQRKNKFIIRFINIIILISSIFLIFNIFSDNIFINILYTRFFESQSGGDLIENERYGVWGIAYNMIINGELFKGVGEEYFLTYKYHFGVHNSWIDIGVAYGLVPFFQIIFFTIFGLFVSTFRYIKYKIYLQKNNIYNFIFIFNISMTFMIFSISVAYKYYIWLILFHFILSLNTSFLLKKNSKHEQPKNINRNTLIQSGSIHRRRNTVRTQSRV